MKGVVKQAGWVGWAWALALWPMSARAAEPAAPITDDAEETSAPPMLAPGAAGAVAPVDFGAPKRIVVSATRIEMPIQNVPTSTSVIDDNVIAQRQYREVGEALQSMRGLSIRSMGAAGSQTSAFIRGMPARYTKVMRDGMPLSDPSSPQGAYDFGGATTAGLSQIEVLRGPQSLLHGSVAAGGVVNMVTRKGEGAPTGHVTVEGGSFGTARTAFGVSAGGEKGDFALSGGALTTDGVSAYDKNQWGFSERDGYRQGDLSLRLGVNPAENLRLDLFAYGQKSRLEYDADWFDPATYADGPYDNPDAMQQVDRYMIRPQAELDLFDGRWRQKLGFGYASTERRYKDRDNPALSYYAARQRYFGETFKFDYQSVIQLHETNTLLAGVDVTTEKLEIQDVHYGPGRTPTFKPDSVTGTGVFLEDRVSLGDVFSAGVGARYDHHDVSGDHWTWKADALYRLPTATTLKASAGTGFRTPTPYERYGNPAYGIGQNENLDPETSVGWDAGFEQGLFDERLAFGGAYFENRIENYINTVWAPGGLNAYANTPGKTKTWGIEAFFRYEIVAGLSLSGQYAWTRVQNLDEPGLKSVQQRRPLNEASVNLDYRFLEKGTLAAGMKYVGRRWDYKSYDWTNPDIRMPSYTTFRLAASWQVNPHVEVFGRAENLFNKKYQDVYGYGATGMGLFGGATLSF